MTKDDNNDIEKKEINILLEKLFEEIKKSKSHDEMEKIRADLDNMRLFFNDRIDERAANFINNHKNLCSSDINVKFIKTETKIDELSKDLESFKNEYLTYRKEFKIEYDNNNKVVLRHIDDLRNIFLSLKQDELESLKNKQKNYKLYVKKIKDTILISLITFTTLFIFVLMLYLIGKVFNLQWIVDVLSCIG